MDKEKLEALREKYSDRPYDEVDNPLFRDSVGLAFSGSSRTRLRTLIDADHQTDLEGLDIALIGVPFDLGVSFRPGARFGPQAIRNIIKRVGPLNYQTMVNPFLLCNVADIGDVPVKGYGLEAGVSQIEEFFEKIKTAGVAPITAGGDHSISYPILKILGRDEPVGLIHIDSHCDTMGTIEDTKFHHGGPFRHAVLDGVLDPERSIQIGIRGVGETLWEFSNDSGMTVIHIEDFMKMGVDGVTRKTREVVGDGPTYISFDVDGLDPVFAPGTGTPEIGGIATREALQFLRGLRSLNIIGGDVVEIAPEYDSTTNTALTGKQLMFEILCLTAENIAKNKL